MASLKRTKTNDYLAADGMWYPSSRLESYFKEKMGVNGLSRIFQDLYAGCLKDLVYKSNPFFDLVPKSEAFSGAVVPVPVITTLKDEK